MTDRVAKMLELRREGWSLPAIAKNFGLSRQRVHQLIGKRDLQFFKMITEKQCVFKGLREWMNKKGVSRTELIRRIYGEHKYHPEISNRMYKYLTGRSDMKKSFIDKILEVTGLSYEECFKE